MKKIIEKLAWTSLLLYISFKVFDSVMTAPSVDDGGCFIVVFILPIAAWAGLYLIWSRWPDKN